MTPHQTRILRGAPRYLYFYRNVNWGNGLIPDTPKARQWAVEQGARLFDAVPLYRFEVDGTPQRWGPGNFSFRVSRYPDRLPVLTARVSEMLNTVLRRRLNVPETSFLRATYIGEQDVEIGFPHAFFSLEENFQHLAEFHKAFAESFKVWARDLGFGDVCIKHRPCVVADNCTQPDGRRAISMPWDEFCSLSAQGIGSALDVPRPVPGIPCRHHIGSANKCELVTIALSAVSKRQRLDTTAFSATTGDCRAWRPLIPLLDASGVSACSSAFPERTVRCAIKLVAWLRSCGVTEFRRRDALRAVDGTFTLNKGVADALTVLIAHGHLKECPFPPYSYPGKRASPWFIVNPAVFSAA
ncbi:hypothetical protein [Azospirillum soli]|uniref:hypothetical protein n=1 Tax=Azospirillum soli TaxID=1304799 RepID=UPI001AE5A1CE|nr:hypothetical protein [Azospirillum soli]MBP2312941.1 hypothetical protein [Azospirillum soli]